MPVVDLAVEGVDPDAAARINLPVLLRTRAIPYRFDDGQLFVAVADPTDIGVIDELRLASRTPIVVQPAPAADIAGALARLRNSEAAEDGDASPVAEAPAVRLVNELIAQAAAAGASDLHLLPQRSGMVVRLRVDGVLHETRTIPPALAGAAVARIKVMARLDIAEHRKPQDGRLSVEPGLLGRELDIRVSVLPTVEGEGVLMRLLEKSREAPTLTALGLSNQTQMALERVMAEPFGALLVTGPTGSGKSTTLYGALADLNRSEISIVTVEDPVEYRLPGIYQVQVSRRAGISFATALRSLLRSDPDVVMVGEIRDLETARISMEAALTGHHLLSTLHTSDAPGALTRLIDMGIEPFVAGSAVTAVLGQRLVRRLCLSCREPYEPTAEELDRLGYRGEATVFYRKRGCPECHKGYRGRIGLFQLLVMNGTLARMTADRATRDELAAAASTEAGMLSFWEDGLEKVAAGLTSADELARVARPDVG